MARCESAGGISYLETHRYIDSQLRAATHFRKILMALTLGVSRC